MKSRAGFFVKNTVIILAGRGSEFAFGIVTTIIVARYLGAAKFGEFAFLRGVGIIMLPIIGYGGHFVYMRELSVRREDGATLLSSSNLIQGAITALLAVVALGYYSWRPPSPEIYLCTFLVLLNQSALTYYRSVACVFYANEKVIYDTGVTLVTRAVTLGLLVLVVLWDLRMAGVFLAMGLANILAFLMARHFVARNFFRPRLIFSPATIRYLVRESWTLIFSQLTVQGYMNINIFQLRHLSKLTEIAFYRIPQQFIEPLFIVPRSIVMSMMPHISKLGSEERTKAELSVFYNRMFKYMVVGVAPVCVLGVSYITPMILLFFGKEYLGATIPFMISIWSLLPFFVITLNESVLTSLSKQGVLSLCNLTCLVVTFAVGYYLIPTHNAAGASAAITCGISSAFVMGLYYVSRHLGGISLLSGAWRPLTAGVAMWLGLRGLTDHVHFSLLIPCAVVLYGAILHALRTFSPEEKEIAASIVKRVALKLRPPKGDAA